MGKRSAGVVLLREERGEILMLVLAGRSSWDLPKGGLEGSETPFHAAKRELFEETGISDVRWVALDPFEVSYRIRKKTSKTVHLFLALTSESRVTISKEHLSYRWLTLAEAEQILPARFQSVVVWVRNWLGSSSSAK